MKKIIYFGIGFILLLSISYFFFYLPNIKAIKQEVYENKAQQMRILFIEEIKNKQKNTNNLVFILSQENFLIEALKEGNFKKLNYNKILDFLNINSDYKDTWIQIIDSKGHSFYRSWSDKKGDSILDIREDISELLNNPKPFQSISAGIYDLSIKSIYPVFDKNGSFFGFIEMVTKLNPIANALKNEKIEPLFVLSKEKSKKLEYPFSKLFIKDNYIANTNANKEIVSLVENYGIDNFLEIKDYIQIDKYLATNLEIKDINGDSLGLFLMFFDKKNLDFSPLITFKNLYLTVIVTFLVFYGLIFLYFIKTIYAKSLNEDVKEKTKKIKAQQKKLMKLLDIYDKNVIFSQTDLKGIITHASSAFCKISGYTKKELIGKPHNIVRHPDMPKELFSNIWSELKKRKRVTVEIKNLRKDGSYYWVVADLEPEYNDDGELIGYFGVREDITANKDIEEIQREVIFSLGSIVESRSKETGEHVKRVASYSKILASAYGLEKDDIAMLELASPMHDIGKIAIPDEILNKPAKLTFEEFEIMKTHAKKGYEMLCVSERPLFKAASQIALTHHEKYDGSGYPNGLKGEDIPIFGRITAIADVFDALGSDRCYKKAWELEDIYSYIKEQNGKHFDPKLVELFFENLSEILKIREKYKDI